MQTLDASLLEILRCPATGSELVRDGEWLYTVAEAEPRRYPIRDGIPIMLVDAAESVSLDEHREVMQRVSNAES